MAHGLALHGRIRCDRPVHSAKTDDSCRKNADGFFDPVVAPSSVCRYLDLITMWFIELPDGVSIWEFVSV
eukprot:SAG31_NODE_3580_length_4100_cov_8.067483_3_plen_70_part_00